MPAAHSRRPSGQQQHFSSGASTRQAGLQPSPPKHQRNNTAPETPTLLRLPSSSSTGASASPRSRRATNPSTPALTPTQASASSATSPSYFSPQPAASGKEARSPATRRPPASFSGHGIDTSRGPPITLITRGNSDYARRPSQQPADFAFAQQQLSQLGLVSPGGTPRSSRGPRQRRDSDASGELAPQTQTNTPTLSRQNSARTPRRQRHMASSAEGSSEYGSGMRSLSGDTHAVNSRHGAADTAGTDGGQGEDLFLNIAEDSAPKEESMDAASRSDRLRSRIARASNRQSFPSGLQYSSPAQSNSTTPNASRIPSAIDTKASTQHRRSSLLPSRSTRDQTPLTPANPLETPRSRLQDLSPKPSFPSRPRDSELSPKDFLAQLELGRRRPSYPDATHTPPNRTGAYRPSNLHYSTSRDNPRTPHIDTPQESASRADGTESHGSTGPATSVWDELDELKSRIRRIELGGKIPATSGAVVSQASADRPRTANTSATTVSSSPNQQRRSNQSPPESTVGGHMQHKVHPLLGEALARAKQHISPAVYRVLEATASEALALAELTGSAGPQGTLHSASSILTGASIPDRQVRRKADNICRTLTELCIVLCDNKSSIASPAVRNTAAVPSRRPSVQINGESPSVRQSIEPESDALPRSSPSRAMSRIEARRASMFAGGAYGGSREPSAEPPTPSQSQIPNRFSRVGTSLHRARRNAEEEDEDLTLRAPSRALTDFRDTRSTQKSRFSREYTSREPMPDLQPSPALQPTVSLRRPTIPGAENENRLLYRDSSRRYNDLDRQRASAYDKQTLAEPSPRTQFSSNRNSIGGLSGINRSGSLNRRLRGTSAGE